MSIGTMWRRGVAAEHSPEEPLPERAASTVFARPHVCFVAPHAWPVIAGDEHIARVGGAEVQQCILARLLAANGYRISMVCLDYGQPDRTVVHGVTVHKAFRLGAGLPGLRFVHPRLTRMYRALRRVDADIYYCRAAGAWIGLVAEYCRLHGKRSVYAGASDADFLPDLRGKIRYGRDRWLYRWGLARVHRIVAQNEVQRATCLETHGRQALVIPSCYDPPQDTRAGTGAGDCVLWVGMLRAGKRPELLLALAARLPHRRFVVVSGPAPEEAELFERIRREAASLPNLEFVGFLPLAKVERRFDDAHVVVNTSEFEGLPNTFLQAWSRGVPTVATVDVPNPAHKQFRDVEQGARQIEALFTERELWEDARTRERRALNHEIAMAISNFTGLAQ